MNRYLAIGSLITTSIALILWFNLCIYVTVAAHYLFPNSLYAGAYNEKAEVHHAYLIIDGKPKDPQLLFLYLSPNVDYENPIFTTSSTEEFLKHAYLGSISIGKHEIYRWR